MKKRGKWVPSRLYIEGEDEWEYSRSKYWEKCQPLDWRFTIGCEGHKAAWSN